MDLNKHVRDFIQREAAKRGWTSNADLTRNIGFTEATWSRVIRLQQKSIKDPMVNSICRVFKITPIDLLLVSEGKEPQVNTVNETPVTYRTRNPKIKRLCEWLENEATEAQLTAVVATAQAVGFPLESTNSSHSGRAASRSAAVAS